MATTTAPQMFTETQYTIRRKVFKIFGGAFHIYAPDGRVVMYSKMKAFKLREDIRIYTGEDMGTEILSIRARQVIDFSATYDIMDSTNGQRLGAMRRKGFKSMFRDEWSFLDNNDQPVGTIREDSLALALVRRYLTNLIPQSYHADLLNMPVAMYKQNFNPFVFKLTVDFSQDRQNLLDRRVGLAAGMLLTAIEGRQQG